MCAEPSPVASTRAPGSTDARPGCAAPIAGEAALGRHAALCHEALDKIRQGLCVYDGEQRLVLFNRRYAEMYNLAPESLRLGMTLREVIDLRYAAGTGPQMAPEEYAAWRDEIAVAQTVVETIVELRNGAVHEIHHEPLPGGGWVATFDDITARLRVKAELRASEERYRALVQASAGLVWRTDADGSLLDAWGWEEFAGPQGDRPKGRAWLELLHPDDRAPTLRQVKQAAGEGRLYEVEYRLRRRSGEHRWVVARGLPLKRPDGTIREWVGTLTDIHDRKTAEGALETSGERLRLALGAGRMVAWELDPETGFLTRSENARELLGLGSGPLSEYLERVHPDDRAKVAAAAKASSRGQMTTVEFRYIRPDGEMVWLEVRAMSLEEKAARRVIGVTFDVTARKQAEERMRRAANHDALTGLANRTLFQSRLKKALSRARSRGAEAVLMVLDLDNFKEVNDTLGHDAGDALLRHVADRLRSVARERDTVARLGGDEFAIVIAPPLPLPDGRVVAERVLAELTRPLRHRSHTIMPQASIGIASFPAHDRDSAELMKDADVALYAAKKQGGSRIVVYSPTMRREIDRKVALAREMRVALRKGQIVPYYQPKTRLSTSEVIGFEALARWRHPQEGLLAPGSFASIFADNLLAAEFGRQMVEQVARDIRAWRDAGLAFERVAVNISAPEFLDPGFAERILGALERAGVAPRDFEIEVTESVFLGNGSGLVAAALDRLHGCGIAIALDDFGTGFASLTHLKQFPVDTIKIDRSFVRDLERDLDDAAIVAAVIGLGKSLHIKVIAEGVETAGQARFLARLGCDEGQGYLYGKPMAASRVPWFLRQARAAAAQPEAARAGRKLIGL